jgi:4-hydroxybenzoate polyprenyltransferase
VLLCAGVLAWVAGFDILYACQDLDADRAEAGLHSIPKSLGLAGAMQLARRLHGVALLFFVLTWFAGGPQLGLPYLLGLVGVGLLLRYQHSLVSPRDLSRIDAAFFTTNGYISVGFLLVTWLDV